MKKKTTELNLEKKLMMLEGLSELLGGENGRLIHDIHKSLLIQNTAAGFAPGLANNFDWPPWPEDNQPDPLEEVFRPVADNLKKLSPEETKRHWEGEDIEGNPWEFPDEKKKKHTPFETPESLPKRYFIRYHDQSFSRGTDRKPPRAIECGHDWMLGFAVRWLVEDCSNVDYKKMYRPTLLRAIAEAFRVCREADANCPDARLWLLDVNWSCNPETKIAHIGMFLAAACVAP